MSTRDREEVYWREMRKQLVEGWNREGIDSSEVDDDIDLQSRVRIPHHREEDSRKSAHPSER